MSGQIGAASHYDPSVTAGLQSSFGDGIGTFSVSASSGVRITTGDSSARPLFGIQAVITLFPKKPVVPRSP